MELSFILENAGWPALVIESGGVVRRANQAALQLFGPVLDSDSTSLASLLCEDNNPPAEQVLSTWERSTPASVRLKFRAKGGLDATFDTWICCWTREGDKRFLLQLYRHAGAGADAGVAPAEREAGTETIFLQKQKIERAAQLARSSALDFNNALTSILGHCSWILSQMPADHAWRRSMEDIEKAAEKATGISHHLARPDKEPAPTSNDFNSLLRRVLQEFRAGKENKQEWNLQLQEHLHTVRCDEGKMRQAVTKILENAYEAAGERGVVDIVSRNRDINAPTLDGSVRVEAGSYVCVEVSDSGPGIPPEVLSKIFEPFFTTKPGHRGLGLAWAYGAITNQGGRISVLSAVGKGTTVRLYIPAQPRAARVVVERKQLAGSETILLVDDEDLVVSLGEAVLGAYGYQVLTANSGEAALEVLAQKEGRVDLAIVDWIMPRMTGKELITQMNEKYPSIPVLLTSGYVSLPAGVAEEEFLRKPFTTQELLQRVRQKLQMKAAA